MEEDKTVNKILINDLLLKVIAQRINFWFHGKGNKIMLTENDFPESFGLTWLNIVGYLQTLKNMKLIGSYEIVGKIEKDNLIFAQIALDKKIDLSLLERVSATSIKRQKILKYENLLTFDLNTNFGRYKKNIQAHFSPDTDAYKLLKNFMQNPRVLFSYKTLFQTIEQPIEGLITAENKNKMREKIRNICTRLGVKNINTLFVCEGGYSLGEYK
jgi:hypothetical protein